MVGGEADKLVDVLLRHKDRLAQLVAAYLNDDQQALADVELLFARRNAEASNQALAAVSVAQARVLLVENSRATLKVCVGLLRQMGVQDIATTHDGYDALGRLLKEPFHAVITALHVPTIDGQLLMPVLRAIPGPNQMTPVILLTSSATAIDSMRARPDYIVENNPNMTQHLKRIVGGLLSGTSGPAKAIASRPPRSLKKIVLVDDSPAIHHLLRSSFKRLPEIAIATLEDPTLAVEFVRKECPDLVLPDLNMPQLSGKEVMRDLKANADLQAIPVAFFTAADRADERAELLELGACHIFKKPFLPKSFADELVAAYHEF